MDKQLKKDITEIVENCIGNVMGAIQSHMQTSNIKARPGSIKANRTTAVNTSGKLPRRNTGEVEKLATTLATVIAKHPNGIRMELLSKATNIPTPRLMLPIKVALKKKLIKKAGKRRGTSYFATTEVKK